MRTPHFRGDPLIEIREAHQDAPSTPPIAELDMRQLVTDQPIRRAEREPEALRDLLRSEQVMLVHHCLPLMMMAASDAEIKPGTASRLSMRERQTRRNPPVGGRSHMDKVYRWLDRRKRVAHRDDGLKGPAPHSAGRSPAHEWSSGSLAGGRQIPPSAAASRSSPRSTGAARRRMMTANAIGPARGRTPGVDCRPDVRRDVYRSPRPRVLRA